MRLLSEEEREYIYKKVTHFRPWDSVLEPYLEAQDKKTLKAVGETADAIEFTETHVWLRLPRGLIPEPIRMLGGEMPEGCNSTR